MSELSDKIQQNAAAPKRMTTDAGTVEQHPLQDQLAADRAAESNTAAKSKNFGIRYGKFRHQGTV